MHFKNNKWKNIVLLSLSLFVLVLVLEIAPIYFKIISSITELLFEENANDQLSESEILLHNLLIENKMLKENTGENISGSFDNSVSSIISLLDESSLFSNCRIKSLTPGKIAEQDNIFFQPLKLELITKYESLYNFIRFLEKSRYMIRIKNLSIRESENNLNVSVNLEAYLNF